MWFAGLLISAVPSLVPEPLVPGALIPWGAGGLGIVIGLLIVRGQGARSGLGGFLLAAIGFLLALYVIEQQTYNPAWLTRAVIFIRVFVSHSLLVPTLLEARQRLGEL